MSCAVQTSFDFLDVQPRRPQRPERTFICLFPDDPVRAEANRISRKAIEEFGLVGKPLGIERYHTSVLHLSDRKRLRSTDAFAADLAARAARLLRFEVVYTHLGNCPGAPKKDRPPEHPLVLLAKDGPVLDLHAALGSELRKYGFRVPETFRPHLTLSYNRQFLPTRAIDPITFVASEFFLVHSRLWLREHHILQRWPLH